MTQTPRHPLAEVFGFPTDDSSPEAVRHRTGKLFPFHNKVPGCTKVSLTNPLGVCSIFGDDGNAAALHLQENFFVRQQQGENFQISSMLGSQRFAGLFIVFHFFGQANGVTVVLPFCRAGDHRTGVFSSCRCSVGHTPQKAYLDSFFQQKDSGLANH